ncbi:MAG: hypothetical protein JWO99_810 [Candidatus Saccharibacteria bacterium]|nr:hypothetical protein [Candidatus Saccharibacteria bacterium]
MSTLKLKSIVRRGTMLGAALAVVAAAIAPASLTFADALNPLTNRSLTLSSSSPGWDFKDGSGNATYAQPNSGANGKQTGNTFSFNVSSTATIKAFTFQYCTTSAGNCMSPGNNGHSLGVRNADSVSGKTSDLNVVTSTPSEVTSGNFSAVIDSTTGIPNRSPVALPALDNSQGNFVVMKDVAGTWTYSGGWTMGAVPKEDGTIGAGTATGANNFITLANTTGESLTSAQAVRIIFFGTNTNYITNPGAGAFFVKINDYNDDTTLDDTTLIDGGVTVANVMNQSIEIQTKVLETMDFSVGTVDPYTLASDGTTASQFYTASGKLSHGQCDPILKSMDSSSAIVNTLQLGDQSAENSLRTDKTYSTHSYWRLSSNSSAGATVYYSGVTLKNTVGDEIAPIGTTATSPLLGTPQFGLALANGTIAANTPTATYGVNYNTEETSGKVYENGADNGTNGVDASVATDTALLTGYHAPKLAPLAPEAQYDQGAGVVNATDYGPSTTAKFAFDPTSNTVPTPIASESASVVDCVTAKVRYIANIAATTPAGIYTTKINYIAAPQY